ncbi:uncharacterized protein EAE97_001693 [Botrytis byssoidea]|uniref:Uncharacterized protein n=1 Tax=Botrytis byssoidea TaxID=139641 RepID=A0A9P5IV17_9HELO|nr:uncharacterized protein EAE97_001693 [Botrytis byssoidea]KAF7952196.1 hypothetical protein EAE97_001693 [Botrytis byssoidea]
MTSEIGGSSLDKPELPSFDIEMLTTGDENSGFHTKNDPSDPWQRKNIINRKGAIDIKCTCVDIVHGNFEQNNNTYGTLLVLLLRIDPRKRSRRVASANISLKFTGMKPGGARPEIVAISLDGRFEMVETTHNEETSKGNKINAGGGALSLEANAEFMWEKKTSADITDSTTIVGSIDLIGFDYGPDNCASWSLIENGTRKTGVPSSMQVGILLKRKHNDPFKCIVEIKAEVDFMSGLERVFGAKAKDDPVFFDPKLKSTNTLMDYERAIERLCDFDLDLVTDVTFVTQLKQEGVVKQR